MSTAEGAPSANGAPDKPNDGEVNLNENENPNTPHQDVPPPPGDSDPHQQDPPPQDPSQASATAPNNGTANGPPHSDPHANHSSAGETPQQPTADNQMWHSGAGAPGQPPGAPGYATYYGAPPPGHHGHAPPHGHHPHPGPHGHHHPDAPYYQQFANMNVQTQAHEVMRNSYQPYLRPVNDDPEIAQAMLNLGSETGGSGSGAGATSSKNGQGAPGTAPAPVPGGAPPPNGTDPRYSHGGPAPGPGSVPGGQHHPHHGHPAANRMMMPGPPPPVGQGQAPPGSIPGQHPPQPGPHSPSGHHQGGAPPPPPPGHYYPPPPPHGHVPHGHHHYYPHPSQMEHDPNAYYNMHMRGGEMAGPPGTGPPMGHQPPHGNPHAGNGAQPKPQAKSSEMYHPKPEATEKKRKRPADMPRRPLSAYNFFFSEERVHVLNSIPDPVDKDAATEGTGSTPATPQPTESKEEVEKKAASTAERLLNIRDAKNVKRRPHRKSHGKIAFKDLARTIGQRWRALTEEGKQKYNALAEKDLQRYNEQMKEYNSKRNRFSVSYQTTPGPLPPQLNAAVIHQTHELRDVNVAANVPPRAMTTGAPGSEVPAAPPGVVMNHSMVGPPGPGPPMHGHPPSDSANMQVPIVVTKTGDNNEGGQNKGEIDVGAVTGDMAPVEGNLNVSLNVGDTTGNDAPQAPDVLI